MRCLALLSVLALFSAPVFGSGEWTDLFDGNSLRGWVNAAGKPAKIGGWVIADGVLHRQNKGAGDLFTAEKFGDFELSLEWKISPKGNSGIKYRVANYDGRWLGPEYQVLDDNAHPDGKNGADRLTAALYYLKPADPKTKVLHPVGEWNSTRIIVKGKHFQHFLNGAKVVDITVGSNEWKTALAKSKFKGVHGFAENPKGRLMLQDHGNPVWYRKIRLRKL